METTNGSSTAGAATPGLSAAKSPPPIVNGERDDSTLSSSSPPPPSTTLVSVGDSQHAVTTTAVPQRHRRLTDKELAQLPSEVCDAVRSQDTLIQSLQDRLSALEGELVRVRESEERLRAQHVESQQREKVLVRRLAAKEQEMQDVAAQMAELKSSTTQTPGALRAALLDPAVNLLLTKLRTELMTSRQRLDETQNELSAWKFTPDSNTGKRLMAKCRLLYTENEELGKLTSSGRVATLEGELALQKSFSEEVKKSQSELDEFLQDLDEDVEGMQSTIYYLQQELRKTKDALSASEQELSQLRHQCGGGRGDETNSERTSAVSVVVTLQNGAKRTHDEDDVEVTNNSAQVASVEQTVPSKKIRRSSVLSLDYHDDGEETADEAAPTGQQDNRDDDDDDALIISTNGGCCDDDDDGISDAD